MYTKSFRVVQLMYRPLQGFNNQKITLLYVYKLSASIITLYALLVNHTKSFRVVQLMYRPLRGYEQSVPKVLVGVQTCLLDHYTSSGVFNVHDKVECCTVDVKAATEILTISTKPCCMCTNLPLAPLHCMHCR